MAFTLNEVSASFVAGADLSSSQYLFVKPHTTENQVVACGDGELAIGVLNDNPASGREATVVVGGFTKVKAGATPIAIGDLLSSTSAGKAQPAGTSDYILGRALQASSTDNTIITIELLKGASVSS